MHQRNQGNLKAPQIDQTSLTGKDTSSSPRAVLYPQKACPGAFFGFFHSLELPAVLPSLSLFCGSPGWASKKAPSIRFPLSFFSSSPWITFSDCFLLCHPGNDKGRYFPFYIHAGEPRVLNFFFPAHDIFPTCPLQDVSGWPYHSVGRPCV